MENKHYSATTTNRFNRWILLTSIMMLGLFTANAASEYSVTSTAGSNGTSSTYSTIKAVFDAINAGGHTGTITVAITANPAAAETAPAVLNASGSGSASYTSVVISPSGGGARTITGAITAGSPLIDLNGADNVTFDGLNTGGNSLTISNTTASATSGTSTIRFIGGATSNTFTNCFIQGSFSAAVTTNGGNIFFSTDGTTANGNDNNTISNCDIGPAGANLPTKCIYGNGSTTTTAIGNSGIIINNNNIHDYFGAAVSSGGIYLSTGNTDWTISNNKFYQAATRTQTTGAQHSAIWITNSSSNAFTVSGNTIGFATSAGTGVYTFVGVSSSSVLIPIFLNVGTTVSTSIQGNTIKAMAMSGAVSGTSSSAAFRGIYVSGGLVNIGDVTGNTIGDMSSTGSITFTSSSSSSADIVGLYNFGSSNWVTSNNNIGGITVSNSSTGAANFYGLRANTLSAATWTISGNTIGGTVANSINSTSTATGTIVHGIEVTAPAATITSNIIRNMTVAGGTGTTSSASMIGICMTASSANHTLSQNTIFNLSNSNATAATVVTGIQYTGTTGTNLVARNNIYALTSSTNSTAAEINGIRVAGGTTTYRNNMIALGAGVTNAIGAAATNAGTTGINGINEALGTDNFWNNSVYIGGSPSTTTSGASYAFNGTQTTNTRSFRDNIFVNARSNSGTATGKNYAIKINGTAANPTGLTINNNIYLANGTGGVLGFFNSLDVATIAAWKTAVGQDASSFNTDPQYLAPTSATPDLHINPSVATAAEGNGFDLGVTDDFDGQTRSGLTPVDIGADAGNFTGLDLSAPTITYTPLGNACGTTGARTLTASITDASGVGSGAGLPTAYFKINAGAYTAVTGTFVSGSTYTFSIGTGSVANDVVSYYIVAQDNAATPNVGSSPSGGASGFTTNPPAASTPPTTPSSYTNISTISGTKNVGAGGDYATITAAITAINAACLNGTVTLNLTDASYSTAETFPITINANSGSGNLVIKPAGTCSITGSSATALFVLNGADNVTIDGSSGSTANTVCPASAASRDLTISNTNTGTASAVIWLQTTAGADPATGNTVKNCNLVGNSNTTTLFGVGSGSSTISISSLGTGNNNNSYVNNNISKTQYGIYSQGASAANKNSGTIINQNLINTASPNNTVLGGIFVGFENNITISANNISGITGGSDVCGINAGLGTSLSSSSTVANEVTNATITKNIIGSVTNTGTNTAIGIGLSSATSGTSTIANNMLSGVGGNGTSGDFSCGILIGGGAGSTTNIWYNTVVMQGTFTGANYPCFALGINGSAPTVNVQNNILMNTGSTGANLNRAIGLGYSSTLGNYTGLVSNHNNFFVSGTGAAVGATGSLSTSGVARTALSDWTTETGRDGGGTTLQINPVFTSATDLHLVASNATNLPLNDGAITVAVTDDIDCNVRATDIGADEFTPPACSGASAGSVSATANGPFCGTSSSTLSFTGTNTGTGLSYLWQSSPDNSFSSPTTLGTGTTQAVSSAVAGTIFYRCTVSCFDGVSTTSSTTSPDFSLTTYITPTATINQAGPISICAPATQTLTASTNATTPTYQWALNGTNIGGSTSSSIVATTSGSYTVKVTENATCTSTSAALALTVNAEVIISSTSATPSTVCNGQSTTLGVNASAGAGLVPYSVSASSGAISVAIPDNSLTGATANVALSGAGSSTVDPTSTVTATVTITHTWDTDLDLYLVGPGNCGTLELSTDNGGGSGSTGYAGTVLTTAAGTNINTITSLTIGAGPYTVEGGISTPAGLASGTSGGSYSLPTTAISGCPVNGSWTLFVGDDASGDVGTITSFALTVSGSTLGNFTHAFSGGSGTISSTSYSGTSNSTGTATVSPTATGLNTYTVLTTSTTGCTKSATMTVTNNPRPTGVLSGGTSYCAPGSTSLSVAVTGTGPWSGTLSPGAVAFSGSSSPISVTVNPGAGTTNYSIATLSDALCAAQAGDLSGGAAVTVNTPPSVSISGPSLLCPGDNITLTATSATATSYLWSDNVTTTSTLSVAANGSYFVTVQDGQSPSCSATSNSITVSTQTYTVTASATGPGTVSPSGASTVTCHDNIQFTFTPTSSCNVLSDILVDGVSVGGGNVTSPYTLSNVTANHTVQGVFTTTQYTVTTSADANGTIDASVTVNCGTSPAITVTANVCWGISDVVIDGSTSLGPQTSPFTYTFTNISANHTIHATFAQTTYTLSASVNGGAGGTLTPAGSTTVNCGDNQQFIATAAPTYSLDKIEVDGIQVSTTSPYTLSNIQANHSVVAFFSQCTNPPTADAGQNATICAGSDYFLGGAIGGGATSAQWSTPNGTGSFDGGGVFGVASIYTPSAADIAAGSVTLTLTTNAFGACIPAVSSLTLSISHVSVTVTGVNKFCTGSSTTLFANVTANGGSTTYQWDNGSPLGTGSSQSVNVAGSYTVTVTTTLNGQTCTATSTGYGVVENSLPSAPVITADAATTFCAGGSVNLSSDQTSGNTWTPGGATSQSIHVTTSGSYSATYTDGNGCTSTPSNTIAVVVNPNPTVTISGAHSVCSPATSTLLTANPVGTGPFTYTWFLNGNPTGGTASTETTSGNGNYTVTVFDANTPSCSGSSAAFAFASNSGPSVTIAASCNPLYPGNTATLTATATLGSGVSISSYAWSPSGGSSATSTPLSAGTYTVTVTDNNGCQGTASFTLTNLSGPLAAGTYTIPSSCGFLKINDAAAYISANGITGTGNVIFSITAPYSETAPAGGIRLENLATGTSGAQIFFQKSGSGAVTVTANASPTTGNITDAIFKLIGADYITFNGLTLRENANAPTGAAIVSATNTLTEWGFALLVASATNGSQNNTIQNCDIQLQRAYPNSFAIYSNVRHQAVDGTTITASDLASSPAGANSGNKIYTNTISNVNYPIGFVGGASVGAGANMDAGNDIGGSSAGTGNTITNWGGSTSSLFTSMSATGWGIFANHQTGLNIGFNSLTSATGVNVATFRGIFTNFSVAAPTGTFTNTITNNTITLNSAATSGTFVGISQLNDASGAAVSGFTLNITNNRVIGCAITGAASSSALSGITNAYPVGTLNITGNIYRGNTTSATSGTINAISNSGAVVTAININNNSIGDATAGAISFSAANSGAHVFITNSGGAATAALSIQTNNFQGISYGVAGTGANTYISNSAATLSQNISSNTFTALNVNTTGSVTFITNTSSVPATGTQNINNNSIVTSFTKGGAGGTVSLYVSNASSVTGAVLTATGNNFSNITVTGATTIAGWSNTDGGTPTKNISSNIFNNWTGGTSAVTGFNLSFIGGVSTFNSNQVTNITGQGAITGMTIGTAGAATSVTVNGNTVTGLTSSGTGGTVTGISSGSPATVVNVTNNIVNTLSTTGATVVGITSSGATTNITGNRINTLSSSNTAAVANGITVSGGTTITVSKNKIYDLSGSTAGATVNGLNLTSGTTMNISNNIIGDLRAPLASGLNAINGINASATSTYKIYYNTIYLTASSSASTFGSSALTWSSSATSLDLQNNILANMSTPGSALLNSAANGISACQRRTSGTAGTVPANYATTSNRNMYCSNTSLGAAVHNVYVEGTSAPTNAKATVALLKTFMVNRDQASVEEDPTPNFTFSASGTGANAAYLHFNAGATTLAESGAANVTGITDDYDNQTRQGNAGYSGTGTAPDIGADEFAGTSPAPVITAITAAPSGNSCSATPHTVTANVSTVAGTVSTVTLKYQFNGGTVTSINMSLTSGNSTNGVYTSDSPIPAATPANATVTFTVTAVNSIPLTSIANGTSYQDAYLTGIAVSGSATPNPVCLGSAFTLNGRVGGAPVTESFETFPATSRFAAWSTAGTITVTQSNTYFSQGANSAQMTYAVSSDGGIVMTSNINMTTFLSPKLTFDHILGTETCCDYGYLEYSTDNGATWQTFPTSAYQGSGTLHTTPSGAISFDGASYAAWSAAGLNGGSTPGTGPATALWKTETINLAAYLTSTTFRIRYHLHSDTSVNYYGWLVDNFRVADVGLPAFNFSWSDGASTIATGASASYTAPAAGSFTYTVVATDANNCTISSTLSATVSPLPSAPVASAPSNQCGTAVPTVSVTGTPGAIIRWYNDPTSTAPAALLATTTANGITGVATYPNSIGTSTTFYVAEFNGNCESAPRTIAVAAVRAPDAIVATASPIAVCQNQSSSLDYTQALNNNIYNQFVWTSSDPNNGMSGGTFTGNPLPLPLPLTQLLAGTKTYTLTATETSSGCIAISTVQLTVNPPPAISLVSASPNATSPATAVCAGSSVQLTAVTPLTVTQLTAASESFENFPASSFGSWNANATLVTSTKNTTYFTNGTASVLMTPDNSADGGITLLGDVNMTTYAASPKLTFDHILATETCCDYGYLEYSTNGGSTWLTFPAAAYQGTGTLAGTPSGSITFNTNSYAAWSGNFTATTSTPGTGPATALWKTETINLAAYTSFTTFRIRYHLHTDSSVLYYGWLVDNVRLLYNSPSSGAGNLIWSWDTNPVSSGNTVTVTPSANTTYNVTAEDPVSHCTASANISIFVNPVPAAPVAGTPSQQCGTGTPTVTVTGTPSSIMKWYDDPTLTAAPHLLATTTADATTGISTYPNTISTTTTFYVSETSPTSGCTGPRTAVIANVASPDLVTVTASPAGPVCPGTVVRLDWTNNSNPANHFYDVISYTSAAGSGITGSVSPTSPNTYVDITPTVGGTTYTYTVHVSESTGDHCATSATVQVAVIAPPVISELHATPSTAVCLGSSVELTAGTPAGQTVFTLLTQDFNGAAAGWTVTSTTTGGTTPSAPNWTLRPDGYVRSLTFHSNDNSQFYLSDADAAGSGVSVNEVLTSPAFSTVGRTGTTLNFFQFYQLLTATEPFIDASLNGTTWTNVASFTTTQGSSTGFVPATVSLGAAFDNQPTVYVRFRYIAGWAWRWAIDNVTVTGNGPSYGPGSLTWSWTDPSQNPVTATPPGNVVTVTPTAAGTNTYTVDAYDGTCHASRTINVVVNPLPAAPSTVDGAHCGTSPNTASVSGIAGATFKWYDSQTNGILLQSSTSPTYNTPVATTTTFWVSQVDPVTTCEGPRAQVVETAQNADAISLAASSYPYCLGQSGAPITLTVAQSGVNNNAYLFNYSASPAANSGMPSPLTNAGTSVNITALAAGTYTYSVTATAGACQTSSSVTISVGTYPVINSTSSSPSPVCEGSTVTLSANVDILSTGPQTLPGTYCAPAQGGGSCVTSVVLNTLNSTPPACLSPWTHTNAATGANTTTLTAGQSYSITLTTNAASIISVWIDYNRNGVYEASEWVQPWTNASTGSATILVPANAQAGLTGMRVRSRATGNTNGATDACTTFFSGSLEDYSVNIIGNTPQVLTYAWTPGGMTSNPATTTAAAGISTYTVTASNASGCSTSATVTVSVNPLPAAPVATNNSNQCGSGIPAAFVTSAAATPNAIFKWYDADAPGGVLLATTTGNGSGVSTYPNSISTSTTFYVAEVSNGCPGPRVQVVQTVATPDPVSASASPSPLCQGATLTLTATSVNSAYTYTWTSTAGSGITTSTPVTGSSVQVIPTAGATYTYTVNATDGHCSTSSTVTAVVNPGPALTNVSATPPTVCAGATVTLSATTPPSVYSYSVTSSSYAPLTLTLANAGPTGDDAVLAAQNIGFTFQYFGVNYTQFTISTNGNIQLGDGTGTTNNPAYSSTYIPTTLPTAGVPDNTIALAWADLTATAGQITWATNGTQLTVAFNNVSELSGGGSVTGWIVLNSTTNTINYYLDHVSYATRNRVMGIEDATGTLGAMPATRGLGTWMITTPEAWTFSPIPPSTYTTSWNNPDPANSFPGSGAYPGSSVVITPTAADSIWTVTSTNDLTGCSATATVHVVVIPSVPKPTITAAPNPACYGSTTTLTVTNPVAGFTYQWQSSTSGVIDTWTDIGGANTTTYAPTMTTDLYFRAYATTCNGHDTADAVHVTVSNPQVTGVSNTPRCGAGPATVTVSGSGSFDWYDAQTGGNLLATNTASYTANIPLAGATYWVQAYIGTCLAPARVAVTVTPTTPEPFAVSAAPGSTTICAGDLLTLTASSNTDPNYVFDWFINGGTSAAFTGPVYTSSPLTSESITVTATDAGTGCVNTFTFPVTVNPVPTIPSVTNSNPIICALGGSSTLSPNIGGLGATYLTQNFDGVTAPAIPVGWTVVNGAGASLDWATTTTGASSAPNAAFVDDPAAIDDKSLVSPAITIPVAGVQVTFQNNYATESTFDGGVLEISINGGAFTDIITAGGTFVTGGYNGTISSSFSSPILGRQAWTGSSAGYITTTVNLPAGAVGQSIQLRWRRASDTSVSSTGWTIDNIQVLLPGQPFTVAWTPTGPDLTVNGTVATVTPSAPGTTTYTVTVTNTNTGCFTTATTSVSYSPLSISVTADGPTSFCNGGSVTLTANGTGLTSYLWNDAGASTSSSITVSQSGSYSVTVSNGTCTVTSSAVTVTNYGLTPIGITPASPSVCSGSSQTLTADAGYTNYSWSDGNSTFTGNPISVSPTTQTTYNLTADDVHGCPQSGSVTVMVNPAPPAPVLSGDLISCWDGVNQTTTITISADISGAGVGATIFWPDFNSNLTTVTANVASTFGATGTYPSTVQVTNNGCTTIYPFNIVINPCTAGITLNLNVYIEGYFDPGSGFMKTLLYDLASQYQIPDENNNLTTDPTATDNIFVDLYTQANAEAGGTTPDYTMEVVLHNDGTAQAVFSGAPAGMYYVAVRHRTSIETWSRTPVDFSTGSATYDFTNSLLSAYDDGTTLGQPANYPPMHVLANGKYGIYSGDCNRDFTMDILDMGEAYNDGLTGFFGYNDDCAFVIAPSYIGTTYCDGLSSDCNGDGTGDILDMGIIYNNSHDLPGFFYSRPGQ